MLLFRPEHVPMILAKTKTQTRRLWKKPRLKVSSIQKCYSGGLPLSKCKVCAGDGVVLGTSFVADEAVWKAQTWMICPSCNGTGRLQPFATVRMLRVWRETLGHISETDARAEGYANAGQYLVAFHHIDPHSLITDLVWAVEFTLMEAL